MNKTLTIFWVVLVAFLIVSGIRVPIGRTIMQQECQPPGVVYDINRTEYCTTLVQIKYVLTSQCFMRITRKEDINTTNYGYSFASPGNCEMNYTILWHGDGINITAPVFNGDRTPLKIAVFKSAFVK